MATQSHTDHSTSSAEPTSSAQAVEGEIDGADFLTREDRVRAAAYASAERRGFEPGSDVQDWLAAEQEVDAAQFADNTGSRT